MVYYVLNRGNDRKPLFHKRGDARAFLQLLAEAKKQVPMRLLGYCLMNNHWHFGLWPYEGRDSDVSAFMAWLCNAHVRRYRQHYHTNGNGHLYQGRFKSFAVQPAELNILMVLRYIEANPLRAGLVQRAEDWPWSSLHHWLHGDGLNLLDPWPIQRPANWLELVNEPLPEDRLQHIRASVKRGNPLGEAAWVQQMAQQMGIESTLRPRGRPRKQRDPREGDTQNIHPPDADAT
jgi:putative transposase